MKRTMLAIALFGTLSLAGCSFLDGFLLDPDPVTHPDGTVTDDKALLVEWAEKLLPLAELLGFGAAGTASVLALEGGASAYTRIRKKGTA